MSHSDRYKNERVTSESGVTHLHAGLDIRFKNHYTFDKTHRTFVLINYPVEILFKKYWLAFCG
jgi:hypothetical protein